jgi:hypothetical protein
MVSIAITYMVTKKKLLGNKTQVGLTIKRHATTSATTANTKMLAFMRI